MAVVTRRRGPEPGTPDLGSRFGGAALVSRGERFTVCTATDARLGSTVFVKTVSDTHTHWLTDALGEQAAVLESLRGNRHVVGLLERVVLPHGRAALVLGYCPSSLTDALRDGRAMPAAQVAHLGVTLAGALGAVHRAGVLHCDVRPATILRRADGEPVLAAFDNAVRVHAGIATYSVLSDPTPHTAPELLLGEAASARTDVYGLAATLYELLAGHGAFRAYAGEAASVTAARVLHGQVRTIVSADVPLALSDLLTWALSPDPADRPPSPAWIAEELRRIQVECGWPRTPLDG